MTCFIKHSEQRAYFSNLKYSELTWYPESCFTNRCDVLFFCTMETQDRVWHLFSSFCLEIFPGFPSKYEITWLKPQFTYHWMDKLVRSTAKLQHLGQISNVDLIKLWQFFHLSQWRSCRQVASIWNLASIGLKVMGLVGLNDLQVLSKP